MRLSEEKTPNIVETGHSIPTANHEKPVEERISFGEESSIVHNLVSDDRDDKIYSTLFRSRRIEYLKVLLKEKKLLFHQQLLFNITPIVLSSILEYFKAVGNIISISKKEVLIQHKNSFILVDVDATVYNLKANQILTQFFCETQEDLVYEVERFSKKIIDLTRSKDRSINLQWYYTGACGIEYVNINDKLNDSFLPEAYPYINLPELCKSYYESDEPILMLIGNPGTGKTRLIRYILNFLCETKDDNINVMFTSDQKIIQNGNLFISFIANDSTDILILEDVDYHLSARRDGNTAMYNFLSISNGLAIGRQQDKKIILSTNLPNTKSIDPALLRPGRCFGIVNSRELYYDESVELLKKLGIKKELEPKKSYTLGELYNLDKKTEYTLNKTSTSTGFI